MASNHLFKMYCKRVEAQCYKNRSKTKRTPRKTSAKPLPGISHTEGYGHYQKNMRLALYLIILDCDHQS